MKIHNTIRRFGVRAAALGMLIAALGLACSAPNTIDQTLVIEWFSVSPTALLPGETAVVEVRVTDSRGELRSGVEVSLQVDPVSSGVFAQRTLTTGQDGTAATVFTAATEGTATISASAEKASDQFVTITVVEVGASAGTVNISVNPGVMAADAASQSIVSCSIYDANGWTISDSTLIRFVAGEKFIDVDQNGFFTQGVDSIVYDLDSDGEWDAIGEIESEAYAVDGYASVYYTAGSTASTVYIKATAFLPGGMVQKDVSLALSAGAGCLSLALDPHRIRADGVSWAEVTMWVCDGTGAAARDSTIVKLVAGEKFFDADRDGKFTPGSQDVLQTDYDGDGNWDAIGIIASSVYTIGGAATIYYIAGTVADSVFIKATVGEGDGAVQTDMALLLLSADSIASIALTPNLQRVQVRGTGGVEWSVLTANAYDAFGNRAPQDLPIEFSITAGPGGGENLNGQTDPVTVLTDEDGNATVTFNAGITSGTVRIRATAGSVVSEAAQIAMTSGPPAYISVGAADCNVPSWEVVNYINEIVAVANDQWGNEVPDSTAIYFWTEQGTIEGFDRTHIAFTERGIAKSVWHSSKPKNDGFVIYWAETAGGEVADTSMFLESGLPGTTLIVIYPTTLIADGMDKSRVLVEVYDQNGVFMDTNYPLKMESTFGSINSGVLGDGCHSSYYEGELVSQTFIKDYHYTIPDSGVIGVSILEAIAGGFYGAYDSKEVYFLSGSSYIDNCYIKAQGTIPHAFTIPVSVVIKDRYGNPLGGHLISLSSQTGLVTGSPQYTDEWGIAGGFSYTTSANFLVSTDFLRADDLDPDYGGVSFTQKITVKEDDE